ncbi:hypothetical protein PTNB73_01521 [Pyrenophora teres f. teres]|uniref:RTA1-domain-containing protein n=1 Tax=Pyrenophora teres f. teres (strain 0-1) TaxID=861557 RepID=E3RQE3_PYRTT|nr:hypothetical protein PTT_10930 [Pyrenophora teres f. teres 0-1]KAE8845536.1 hypothetical protein HRS9139_00103 [Pyrenophora teres f. teres]KAE8872370.1 hypothetical protein PTNB73_01521 [Pyrenophora teres f. teres]
MSRTEYHPALNDPNVYFLYRYTPSKIAAGIFVIAFGFTTFAHIFQLFQKRTWYFTPLIIGGLFEMIGFIGRFISHEDIWALGPFIMQSLLILLAPALFAASIYIILGRIILLVDGERYSLVRHKWLTKVFVAGDIFSFLLQGTGAGIQAMATESSMHLGSQIIIGGLFVQLVFFGLFIVVSGVFHYRLVKDIPLQKRYGPSLLFRSKEAFQVEAPSKPSLTRESLSDLPWKRHLFNLYFASALILVRSTFRVIEYIGGNAGYLLSHEVFLYIFDALLMFFVMVSFNMIHPSQATEMYHMRLRSESSLELQQAPVEPVVRDEEQLTNRQRVDSGAWLSGCMPFRR